MQSIKQKHNPQIFTEDSRTLAANVRGIGMAPQEIPEWKKHVIGGKKSSFGKKTDLTLIEQRQSLPIYKLREDLIKVSQQHNLIFIETCA